ncbi:Ribosomal L1 domain-containing protein 1, partial [Massospora cicadina]
EHVFLSFSLNNIPSEFPSRPYFFDLPFPIHPADTEVCLFTADSGKSLVEPLIQSGKLPQLREVISISDLKALYTTPESRRMLCTKYGAFVAQDVVLNILPPLIGKPFFESKKLPSKIRVNENFAQNFTKVFSKAVMVLPTGNHLSIKVGNVEMGGDAIVANILCAAKHAVARIPGGIKSVASISIKTSDSVALPISFDALDDTVASNRSPIKRLGKEAILAERIAAYNPTEPLTVDVNGKKKLKGARSLVRSLVEKFKGPITVVTLPTPDYPSRQFSSTEFLAMSTKELLHKHQFKANPDAATSEANALNGPAALSKASKKKSSDVKDARVTDSKTTEPAPTATTIKRKKRKHAAKGQDLTPALPEPSEAASGTPNKQPVPSTQNKEDLEAKSSTAQAKPDATIPAKKARTNKHAAVKKDAQVKSDSGTASDAPTKESNPSTPSKKGTPTKKAAASVEAGVPTTSEGLKSSGAIEKGPATKKATSQVGPAATVATPVKRANATPTKKSPAAKNPAIQAEPEVAPSTPVKQANATSTKKSPAAKKPAAQAEPEVAPSTPVKQANATPTKKSPAAKKPAAQAEPEATVVIFVEQANATPAKISPAAKNSAVQVVPAAAPSTPVKQANVTPAKKSPAAKNSTAQNEPEATVATPVKQANATPTKKSPAAKKSAAQVESEATLATPAKETATSEVVKVVPTETVGTTKKRTREALPVDPVSDSNPEPTPRVTRSRASSKPDTVSEVTMGGVTRARAEKATTKDKAAGAPKTTPHAKKPKLENAALEKKSGPKSTPTPTRATRSKKAAP